MVHWWGKIQVAEKCRSAILTTYETDLRTWSLTSNSLHSGGWVAGGVDYEDRALRFSQYLIYSPRQCSYAIRWYR